MIALSYKRIAAIAGFIALVLLFATLLYLVFFRATPETPINNEQPGPGTLPTAGPGQLPTTLPGTPTSLPTVPGQPIETTTPTQRAEGGLTLTTPVVDSRTFGATLGQDGRELRYYQPSEGIFYRVMSDGRTEKLTDTVFHDVQNITWSPNRDGAVLEYPDGSNIVYDFRTKKQVTLPRHWEQFSFSPEGDQLAFKSIGLDEGSQWLAVASIDGGASQAIEQLGSKADSVDISWSPNRQIIAQQREVSGTDRQTLYFIGLNGENFRSMAVVGLGLQTQWTPDGARLLYSTSSSLSDYKPLLWVADASGDAIGQNRQSLGLNTWADKCAFESNTSLICAVPQQLAAGAGFDPIGSSAGVADNLYRVDVVSGQRQLLAQPTTPVNASHVMVAADRSAVYLEEANTGHIYKINL